MQGVIDTFINNIIFYLQAYGLLFGCFIVVLESIIPILPLGVFIAFNMMAFGNIVGFIMSLISTSIGCLLSYFIFYYFGKKLEGKIKKHPKLEAVKTVVTKVTFSNLVLIIAIPFSPSFLINIACGLAKVDFKKFIISILIGKISIVYFWGFISKSLMESITDVKTLGIILIILMLSYFVSKIVNRKFNID